MAYSTNATIDVEVLAVRNMIYLWLLIALPIIVLIGIIVVHARVPWHGRHDMYPDEDECPIIDYPMM
jgi:hypothetical protein